MNRILLPATGPLGRGVRFLRTGMVALALGAVAVVPARADPGWEAIRAGDMAAADAYWRPLAESGDVNAMVGMGNLASMTGRDADAAGWYARAAAKGERSAQVLLASAYLEGRGVERDPLLAYAWYHLAALEGHPKAGAARDLAAQWLTPEQVSQARAMAERWRAIGPPGAAN